MRRITGVSSTSLLMSPNSEQEAAYCLARASLRSAILHFAPFRHRRKATPRHVASTDPVGVQLRLLQRDAQAYALTRDSLHLATRPTDSYVEVVPLNIGGCLKA